MCPAKALTEVFLNVETLYISLKSPSKMSLVILVTSSMYVKSLV